MKFDMPVNFFVSTFLVFSLFLSLSAGATQHLPDRDSLPSDPGWTKYRLIRSDINFAEKAQELVKKGKYGKAAGVYGKMVNRATAVENEAYALRMKARNLLKAGKLNKAYDAYKNLAGNYPRYTPYDQVNMKLRRIAAAYASGEASFFGASNLARAREIYQTILQFAPAGPQASEDLMHLAELQRRSGRNEEAMATYRKVIRQFRNSKQAKSARLELAELLVGKAKRFEEVKRFAQKAKDLAQEYMNMTDSDKSSDKAKEIIAKAKELLADRLMYLARFYTGVAHYRPEAAKRYLNDVISQYSNTSRVSDAEQMLASISDKKEKIKAKDEKKDVEKKKEWKKSVDEMITKSRRLPQPPDSTKSVEKADSEEKKEDTKVPQKEKMFEKEQRVKKWLRPIEDLGL